MNKYDLVYIDVPWNHYGSPTKNAAAGKHYQLLSQEDLRKLPIKSLLNKKSMVFMWATGPRLHYAFELINEWKLYYRGIAFVWVKTRQDGTIINGQGVPPTFTKPTTELILLATTNKHGRAIPLKKFNTPQVVLAPRTRLHSEKPEIFRQKIEETLDLEPHHKKIEIFGRKPVPGWKVIGKDIDGQDINNSLNQLITSSKK